MLSIMIFGLMLRHERPEPFAFAKSIPAESEPPLRQNGDYG